MNSALSFVFVLALLAGALWLARKYGIAHIAAAGPVRRKAKRQMEVIERLALSGQHSLHLVRVGDRQILMGVSPAGCHVLKTAIPLEAARIAKAQ
jgi:flagellar biosynthetic protein FliO